MLVVLASYPKSGNTWVRRFLCCYTQQRAVPLNEMSKIIPSDVGFNLWQPLIGIGREASDEVYFSRRADFYQRLKERVGNEALFFLKSHSAYGFANGSMTFDDESIEKYIHIVRNPLDVLPSFAHHLGISLADAWEKMKDPRTVLEDTDENPTQFTELLLSWDMHTESWQAIKPSKKYLCIRYEDMSMQPKVTFRAILEHVGIPVDDALLEQSIHWSSFSQMKQEEQALPNGFHEAPALGRLFFRKGQIGSGKDEVPQSIKDEMWARWQPLLENLNYENYYKS